MISSKLHGMTKRTEPVDQCAADRLRQARLRRGFSSARAAARFFSWNYNAYTQHENGKRGLRNTAKEYAKELRVPLSWLLTGEGNPGWKSSSEPKAEALGNLNEENLRRILELVFRSLHLASDEAADLASTVVECLSGPPLDAVGRNVVQSFQVRFELEAKKLVPSDTR